jgi:hypothetical protein
MAFEPSGEGSNTLAEQVFAPLTPRRRLCRGVAATFGLGSRNKLSPFRQAAYGLLLSANQLVEMVGPPLHHSSTLLKILSAIVSPPNLVALTVVQLSFDNIRASYAQKLVTA